MNELKLYEITAQFKELDRLVATDDLPQELIRDTIEGLVGTFEDKAVSVVKFIRNLEVLADIKDETAKQMKESANRVRRRSEAVKAYLLFQMQATGISKIECPEFSINVRTNPESLKINIDARIPDEYMVTPEPPPPQPDKKAIKAALKGGAHIDGCYLEAGQRVEIKI